VVLILAGASLLCSSDARANLKPDCAVGVCMMKQTNQASPYQLAQNRNRPCRPSRTGGCRGGW